MTDTIFAGLDVTGLVKPEGSGCRLRLHLDNGEGIEAANVACQRAEFY